MKAVGLETLARIGESWAANDPEGVLRWLGKQANETLESRIAPIALGQLAHEDPELAIGQVASLRSEKDRVMARGMIGHAWAQRDPAEALRWMLSFSTAELDEAMLKRAVAEATSHDPVAMAHSLESLEHGSRRDGIVAAFAQSAMAHDAVAATTWASTIADDDTRRSLLQRIVRDMAAYDHEGARECVRASTLSASERELLLEQIDEVAGK